MFCIDFFTVSIAQTIFRNCTYVLRVFCINSKIHGPRSVLVSFLVFSLSWLWFPLLLVCFYIVSVVAKQYLIPLHVLFIYHTLPCYNCCHSILFSIIYLWFVVLGHVSIVVWILLNVSKGANVLMKQVSPLVGIEVVVCQFVLFTMSG